MGKILRQDCEKVDSVCLLRRKEMDEQSVDYGNWVPKKLLIALLLLTSLFGAATFLPIHTIVRVLLGILAVATLLLLLYMYYSYRVFSANGGFFQKKIRGVVLDTLAWDGKGKALDIGTGAGALAIGVAKKYPDAEVTGIDYWGKGWNYAKEMCEKNAGIEGVGERTVFQKVSAANLPFGDGEFDAAVSNLVFHEVNDAKDKRDVIREALRVVRKGGVFSFQDLFRVRKHYGDMDDLLATIRKCGVEEVYFTDTCDLVEIPRLLRIPLMFGDVGVIYGRK
jgi:SAM-dependent methyltransferase